MTYRGHVQDGVVILDDSPSLEEGTVVNVVTISPPLQKPPIGSAEAIMQHAGAWAADSDETDRLLAELKETKRREADSQQHHTPLHNNPLDAA